jgi:regulator of replication initiation timing
MTDVDHEAAQLRIRLAGLTHENALLRAENERLRVQLVATVREKTAASPVDTEAP